MRIAILGPVSLVVGDEARTVRATNSRTLLAQLSLRAGRTVPTSELTTALWGFEPPAHARRATQLAVTRLRSVLAPFGARGLVRTRADGYLLDIAPHDVDLGAFEEELRTAAAARAARDAGAELRALEGALGLWRGDALADVHAQALTADRHRLDEQRLQAVERRNDLLLASGRGAELLADLGELTARHPARERFWAQYVRALRSARRRSEALEAYETVRRRLVRELGVAPGPELRALHAELLGGPAREAGAGRPATPPVPRQLPGAVPGFVGRAGDVARLDALLPRPGATGPAVAVVTGGHGIGKTSLVRHWARRVADDFPDGQLWISLHGSDDRRTLTADEATGWLVRALGGGPCDRPVPLDERAALVRSLADGRRLLIVVDDVRYEEQVAPLLPGTGGSMVVVTGRAPLLGLFTRHGAASVPLAPLTAAEARALLARRLGTAPVAAEPLAADALVARCAGLPLALADAAGRVSSGRCGTLRDALDEISGDGCLTRP
ncbi:BTAD domain-containing putative transcriptional regulator [Streptomyces sp. B93]|uniref:AfsR/SARP family transcriptional regulator n=1 Tax=Streptomyces sp. B93 TaxID=2824875 RepID=UPI001B37502C|nr:BTAD domain-containing putative transcriptional regulator [Streptomyces sp. B93]MBQ1090011.1 AAA family ATPase [Streptomyces sp. B93]